MYVLRTLTKEDEIMAKTVGDQMAIINSLHKRHETIYRDYAEVVISKCIDKQAIVRYVEQR